MFDIIHKLTYYTEKKRYIQHILGIRISQSFIEKRKCKKMKFVVDNGWTA